MASRFQCSICHRKLASAQALGTHILTTHCSADEEEEEKVANPILCENSDKNESNYSQLRLPREPTESEMEQGFMSIASDSRRGRAAAIGEQHYCLWCGKKYRSLNNVREHIRTHTEDFKNEENVDEDVSEMNDLVMKEEEEVDLDAYVDEVVDDSTWHEVEEELDDFDDMHQIEPEIIIETQENNEVNDNDVFTTPLFDKNTQNLPESPKITNICQIALPTQPLPLSEAMELQQSRYARRPSLIEHYTCCLCSKSSEHFATQSSFWTHLKSVHIDNLDLRLAEKERSKGYCRLENDYLCLSCGKRFGEEQPMRIHMNVHFGDELYPCTFCGKIFAHLHAFQAHCKEHSGEKSLNNSSVTNNNANKYYCQFCQATFLSRRGLVAHEKMCSNQNLHDLQQPIITTTNITTNEAPMNTNNVVVNVTNTTTIKSVRPKSNRRRPPSSDSALQGYVPDNNSCNVLGLDQIQPPPTAAERKLLFCQRPIHTGQMRYICTECGKHYTTMYNMRQHRNVHTKRNLHVCRYCNKAFTHRHVWETHERAVHTKERPFKCPMCFKDFADRSNFRSHKKLCAAGKALHN